jgi:ATP-dependent Clp protease ATP-binding subunit ClpC
MARIDRMTDRARRVLSFAEREARRLGAAAVDPEHLLLALAFERGGVAAAALENLGAGLEQIAAALPPAPLSPVNGAEPLLWSSGTERAVARAYTELAPLGHNYVGTEHLVLGVVLTGGGKVPEVLNRLGVSAEKVQGEVYAILGHGLS